MLSADSYFILAEEDHTTRPYTFIVLGTYAVPPEHIISGGTVTLAKPMAFNDISTGNYTFVLDNSTGIYSPDTSDFVLADSLGDNSWYKLEMAVGLAYGRMRSDGFWDTNDNILLFYGYIVAWSCQRAKAPGPDGGIQRDIVQVTCKDYLSVAFERTVGDPDSDGTANPFVRGTVVKSGLDISDTHLGGPDKECTGEESAGEGCFDTIYEANGGTFSMVSTVFKEGSHAFESTTAAVIGSYGMGGLSSPASGGAGTPTLVSADVYIDTEGVYTTDNLYFMQICSGGLLCNGLFIDVGGGIWFNGPGFTQVQVSTVEELKGRWVRISIACEQTTPGIHKCWIDGDCVASIPGNFAGTEDEARIGLYHSGANARGGWIIYFDNCQISTTWYPFGYYLPGYPYDSVDNAYEGVLVIPRDIPSGGRFVPMSIGDNPVPLRSYFKGGIIARGITVYTTLWDAHEVYGLVEFTNYSSVPSGSIMIRATHDAVTHPIDILIDLFEELGIDDLVDSDGFDAAKAEVPDDSIGVWFQEQSGIEAMRSICARCLYELYMEGTELKLMAYNGVRNNDYEMTLDEDNIIDISVQYSFEGLFTIVQAKYAWYEKNNSLFYETKNTEMETLVGEQRLELDYTYAGSISSDAKDMVEDKADKLLTRMGSPRIVATVVGNLDLARLELGDAVLIDYDKFFDAATTFEVFRKVVDFDQHLVSLVCVRFTGEADS